jgi:hypothetical protein
LLSARELPRLAVLEAGQADQLEHRARPARALGLPEAALLEAVGDVVAHAQVREERVGLEHRVDVALVGGQPGDVVPADPHLAFVGPLEARDQAQRRRLPAPRRPEEREELARPDLEVDAVDGRDVAESLRDSDELDVGSPLVRGRDGRQ